MIRLDRDGAFWTLTLDRPDKANALTAPMLERIEEIATQARGHAQVLVLTGAGDVFSAGADLDAARAGLATSDLWERVSGAVARFDGLSVAVLNGSLAGGAMGMVLACDLRLAVPGARFFYPVMKLGFLPQPSDPGRLRALIGPSRARLMLLAGERIDAATALDWGLVDKVVPRDALDPALRDLTADARAAPRDVLRGIKAMCASG